jgi:putative FmdB family regulatory protein
MPATGLHSRAKSPDFAQPKSFGVAMPIYEFECSACGHVFDHLQKISDPDPTVCPECGKKKIHRRVTAPAFRLAGSGWYETDFKKDGDRKRNLAGKDEAPKPEPAKSEAAKPEKPAQDAKPKSESSAAAKPKPE